jgi:hypothetical protein
MAIHTLQNAKHRWLQEDASSNQREIALKLRHQRHQDTYSAFGINSLLRQWNATGVL